MTLTCGEKISLVILAAIGLRILLRISVLVWKKLIAPSFGFGIDVSTQGRWAVVTGASSGIGKAYAEQLAAKGLDVILISRNVNELEKVATDIKERYAVQARVIEVDLTEGQPSFAKIAKATEDLEIAVVVNNAGTSYEHPEFFTELSEEFLARILQINVAAVTGISRIFLPKMYERRKGVLINVSSSLAVTPSPYLTVYAASKAYVRKLSIDLAAEAETNGVTVQCVAPGVVATKMSKIKKATWMAPSAEKYVESALKTVGIEHYTTGYPPHFLLVAFVQGLCCICEKGTVWLVAKTLFNIRARALKRKTSSMQETGAKDSLVAG